MGATTIPFNFISKTSILSLSMVMYLLSTLILKVDSPPALGPPNASPAHAPIAAPTAVPHPGAMQEPIIPPIIPPPIPISSLSELFQLC